MTMHEVLSKELKNAGFDNIDGVWRKGDLWVYENALIRGGKVVRELRKGDFQKNVEYIRSLFQITEDMNLHENEYLVRVGGELHIFALFQRKNFMDVWVDRKQVFVRKKGEVTLDVENPLRREVENVGEWYLNVEYQVTTAAMTGERYVLNLDKI